MHGMGAQGAGLDLSLRPPGDPMRIAYAGGVLLTAAALCFVPINTAIAQLVPEPVSGFSGMEEAGPNLVSKKDQGKQATNATTVIYDNTTSAANFGFSSTDLLANWGDELFTTATGLLSTQQFSVFNSGSSAGPLLTANFGVQIFDFATSTLLGSYSTSVNFGAGLAPGFFSLINVTALDGLGILLPTTDLVVIQRVISKTGAASRLGIASLNPPTIGASPATMWINALTVGPAGFYTVGTTPANPGYQLAVAPPPVGVTAKTWSSLKKLYR